MEYLENDLKILEDDTLDLDDDECEDNFYAELESLKNNLKASIARTTETDADDDIWRELLSSTTSTQAHEVDSEASGSTVYLLPDINSRSDSENVIISQQKFPDVCEVDSDTWAAVSELMENMKMLL